MKMDLIFTYLVIFLHQLKDNAEREEENGKNSGKNDLHKYCLLVFASDTVTCNLLST